MTKSISILGAGISGLTAAICLASSGRRIVIYEKEENVGLNNINIIQAYKNYDHDSVDALNLFQGIGLEIKPYHKIYKVVKYNRENTKREVKNDTPIYYLFLRGLGKKEEFSLEWQLKAQAEKLGVMFRSSETIKDADIIATGTTEPNIFSYGGIFKDVNIEDAIYILYDFKYAPKGYVYILPYKDNRAFIANVCFDNNKIDQLKLLYDKLLKENKVINDLIKDSELLELKYGIGGYHQNLLNNEVKNQYFIGEAGGFIDPARGFGLRYAFLSGYLVAKAITENLDFKKLWQKRFGNELINGYKRRKIFNKLNDEELSKLIEKMEAKSTLKEYVKRRMELENEVS